MVTPQEAAEYYLDNLFEYTNLCWSSMANCGRNHPAQEEGEDKDEEPEFGPTTSIP